MSRVDQQGVGKRGVSAGDPAAGPWALQPLLAEAQGALTQEAMEPLVSALAAAPEIVSSIYCPLTYE